MYITLLRKTQIRKLTYSAVCLALCMVLPFLTGQIPQIGSALCPMHIPVLLAGFLCGPWWAMAVGAVAPVLRFAAMCFELATYGLVSGLLYNRLPRNPRSIYLALIAAMLAGRIVWGCAMVVLLGTGEAAFTWAAFLAGAFVNAIPGIIVHILLIPLIVLALQKAKIAQ